MPHEATRRFEKALCEYTGSPYAVAVSSCTDALMLSVAWHLEHGVLLPPISIPNRTYVGVAWAIRNAGGTPEFRDERWSGLYQLKPLKVYDAAKRFKAGMYTGGFQCVSFHVAKILGDSQGGAILHDSPLADPWFRKARFDGRTEGVPLREDKEISRGFHCYMSSDVANRLHAKLTAHSFPRNNPDQCPEGFLEREYSDLSKLHCFG